MAKSVPNLVITKNAKFISIQNSEKLADLKFKNPIGLHHPLDGITNPKYKLLHFIQITKFFATRRRH